MDDKYEAVKHFFGVLSKATGFNGRYQLMTSGMWRDEQTRECITSEEFVHRILTSQKVLHCRDCKYNLRRKKIQADDQLYIETLLWCAYFKDKDFCSYGRENDE